MGDTENNEQHSKKRAAGVQLSRENPGLDDDQETGEEESGTFKRASEEVLATRRIVKVRRQPTSTTSAAADPPASSNPFSAIRLVPAASTATEGGEREESGLIEENKETKESNLIEESKGKFALITEKTQSGGDNVKQSESTVDNSQGGVHDQNDDTDAGNLEGSNLGAVEVAQCEDSEDGEKKYKGADNSKKEVGEGAEGEGNNDEKEKEGATTEKHRVSSNFSSFGQLSSNQNAFSGLSGTGFSSSSFSFGSIPKDGSPQGSSIFSFGVSNNGNSAIFFGTGSNSSGKSEGSKITPMPEVSVETGEENEESVFAADSVLYEFSDGSWKERGKGELKLNISKEETVKARLVMRARGNFRLILNAILFPDMKLTSMEKKGITFACVNSAGEGKDGLSTFALKFKDASIVNDFRSAVMEHKGKTPAAMKTPENSPKATD